jgi:hypothetical protein
LIWVPSLKVLRNRRERLWQVAIRFAHSFCTTSSQHAGTARLF